MKRVLLVLALLALPAAADMQPVDLSISNVSIDTPTTDHSGKALVAWATDATIVEVRCSVWSVDDAATVTIQLDERVGTTRDTAGTDVMSTTLVCDNNEEVAGAGETVTITNPGILTTNRVAVMITAISPGSTPTALWIGIKVQQ